MAIDLTAITDALSSGFSGLLTSLTDPSTVATTTTTSATSTATTGTGLSLFVKTAPLAMVAAHPVMILAALGGGLGLIGVIDVVSEFKIGRHNDLASPVAQEKVQKA